MLTQCQRKLTNPNPTFSKTDTKRKLPERIEDRQPSTEHHGGQIQLHAPATRCQIMLTIDESAHVKEAGQNQADGR